MSGIVWGRGLCVLGISDIRGIYSYNKSGLTYGANDEAKFVEFIVVEGTAQGQRAPLGGVKDG